LENLVSPEVEVYVDALRLQPVFLHLESNAIKFRGQDDPYVRINATIEGERVIVTVRDNGVGIAPEKIPSIFDPFVQGEDSYTSPTQGAGLGLSICKGFIEHHGGSIWVESEIGRGSCFSFSLPLPPQEPRR
jgi:signal transduction histidine kinase